MEPVELVQLPIPLGGSVAPVTVTVLPSGADKFKALVEEDTVELVVVPAALVKFIVVVVGITDPPGPQLIEPPKTSKYAVDGWVKVTVPVAAPLPTLLLVVKVGL